MLFNDVVSITTVLVVIATFEGSRSCLFTINCIWGNQNENML